MQVRVGILCLGSAIGSLVQQAAAHEFQREIADVIVENVPFDEVGQGGQAAKKRLVGHALSLQDRCDVLLGRGALIAQVKPYVTVPVVECPVTSMDILEALYRARAAGATHVALILHRSHDHQLDPWIDLLRLRATKFIYEDALEALGYAEKARHIGADTVIAGPATASYASSLGFRIQVIDNTYETVRQALQKAIDLVHAIRRERENIVRFQTLLDSAHEGIIFTDEDGKIAYASKRAVRMLGRSEGSLSQEPLGKVLKQLGPLAGQNNTQQEVGKPIRLGGKSVVANVTPIFVGNVKIGTVVTLIEASELQEMEYNLRRQSTERGLVARFTPEDIVGESAALEEVRRQLAQFAPTDATVLICGETGTGKELCAHSIHQLSRRKDHPFVAINCSALPKDLIESELFGYEPGAFTGAQKAGKPGLFELAHGGTLFLDEIGSMPLEVQAKLLRVIQEREVLRVGGTRMIPVDVRLIAATNRNLWEAVRSGEFRQDLLFRLNTLLLRIPPLRERPEDIPVLFEHFVTKFRTQAGLDPSGSGINIAQLTPVLQSYRWPGNVRELQHVAYRFVLSATEQENHASLLSQLLREMGDPQQQQTVQATEPSPAPSAPLGSPRLQRFLYQAERELICQVGEKTNWNRKAMAEALGISLSTLWRRMKKAGLI